MEKAELIAAVLDAELEMFLRVPAAGPARCQQSPDGFRLARGAVFEAWSERTLSRYWGHLLTARAEGRNLFTERYARMEKLIPAPNDSELIDDIVEIEAEWQRQVQKKYPHVVGQGKRQSGDASGLLSFTRYLRSELETYSDDVLASYYADLLTAQREGRNLVEEKYARMFQKLGYSSLEEAEKVISRSG